MSRIQPKYIEAGSFDQSAVADLVLRQEPDEEEDEEDDQDDHKKDEGDSDEDEGYSE